MKNYGERAEELFRSGYNCAQAVLGAFAEDYGLEMDKAMKMASSFGGGIGGMRSVCGAVSGMCMAAGLIFGYQEAGDMDGKKAHYLKISDLVSEFQKETGSIICAELLGRKTENVPIAPSERTEEYYKKRPCPQIVRMAADILEKALGDRT